MNYAALKTVIDASLIIQSSAIDYPDLHTGNYVIIRKFLSVSDDFLSLCIIIGNKWRREPLQSFHRNVVISVIITDHYEVAYRRRNNF